MNYSSLYALSCACFLWGCAVATPAETLAQDDSEAAPSAREVRLRPLELEVVGFSASEEVVRAWPSPPQRMHNTARARYLQARLLLMAGQEAEALEQLREARKAQPDDVYMALGEIRALIRAAKPKKAVEAAKAAAERYPDSFEVQQALAEALMESRWVGGRGGLDAAIAQFDVAHEMRPRNLRVLNALGQLGIEAISQAKDPELRKKAIDAVIDVYSATFEASHGRARLVPLLRLAGVYEWLGDLDKAAEYYARAVEVDRRNVEVRLGLAELQVKRSARSEAIEVLREALIVEPSHPTPPAELDRLLAEDSVDDLLDFYRRLAADFRNNPDIKLFYAERLRRYGHNADAIREYREIADQLASDLDSRLALAALLVAADRVAEASGVLDEIEVLHPSDPETLSALARLSLQAGLTEETGRLYRQAVEAASEDVKPRYLRYLAAFLYDRKADYKGAAAALIEAKAIRPTDRSTHYLLALYSISENRYLEALEIFGLALKNLPEADHFDIHTQRAGLYELLGMGEKALAALESARGLAARDAVRKEIDIRRANQLAALGRHDEAEKLLLDLYQARQSSAEGEKLQLQLGILYEMAGRFDDSEKAYRKLIENNPKRTEPYLKLGMMFDRTNQTEKAEELYRKVIQIEPTNADAYNNLGYLLAVRGVRLEEARELIEKALEIQPRAGHIVDSLGWVLYKLERYEEAVEKLQAALTMMGLPQGDPEVLEHLGDAYRKLGRNGEAREAYKKALVTEPNRASVLSRIEEMEDNPALAK